MPFADWPATGVGLAPEEVIELYRRGFAGAKRSPEKTAALRAWIRQSGGWADARPAMRSHGLAGSGAGQLVTPFQCVEKCFPGCWPGAAQEVGDCVSHSTKNAALTTLACEIEAGNPDQVTGLLEGIPDVPAKGITEGVLSTEAIYWYRRHAGHGWFCSDSVKVVCSESGCWLRKPYPDIGIDLTEYSGRLASEYGRTPPGDEITSVGKMHLVRTSTECTGDFGAIRDLLANGYGVTSCGSEGFSSERDENGVSRRQGSWAHAMAYIAADDREEIKAKYGEPLVLVMNSWGVWNSGPTRIMGLHLDIPQGSFWARWSDVRRRECFALSSIAGWPRKKLPDYGGSLAG